MIIDEDQFKQLTKSLDGAKKMMESSLQGVPERIEAFGKVTADEAKLFNLAIEKKDSVYKDVNEGLKDLKGIIKL